MCPPPCRKRMSWVSGTLKSSRNRSRVSRMICEKSDRGGSSPPDSCLCRDSQETPWRLLREREPAARRGLPKSYIRDSFFSLSAALELRGVVRRRAPDELLFQTMSAVGAPCHRSLKNALHGTTTAQGALLSVTHFRRSRRLTVQVIHLRRQSLHRQVPRHRAIRRPSKRPLRLRWPHGLRSQPFRQAFP